MILRKNIIIYCMLCSSKDQHIVDGLFVCSFYSYFYFFSLSYRCVQHLSDLVWESKCTSFLFSTNIQNVWKSLTVVDRTRKIRKTQKMLLSECLLRLGVQHVAMCVCLCKGHCVMVPLNLTCLHFFQHSFFNHRFNLYIHM